MPQVQFIDQPGIGSALGDFGSGILDKYTQGRERDAKEDALEQALSQAQKIRDQGGSEEDVVGAILGQKGLPFEEKKGLSDIFSNISKKKADIEAKKRSEEREEGRLKISRDKYDLDLKKLSEKERAEYKKDMQPLNTAISTVEEMKRLRGKNNLGKLAFTRQVGSSETRRDIGAYKTAAKSLISMIMNIPIRNKHEFLEAAEELTDPYLSNERAEGIISELERRFSEEMDFLNKSYSKQEGPDNIPPPDGQPPTLEQVREAIRRKKGKS